MLSSSVKLLLTSAILGISAFACDRSETENLPDSSKINFLEPPTEIAPSNQSRSYKKFIFAGSGANIPIIKHLAAEFVKSNPGVKIEVPPSIGTLGAVNALIDGEITVGLASRDLKDEEKKFGLRTIPYAQTALVMGAHPSVSDDNITSADLVEIYQGRKTRWSNGKEIVVLTREPGDSSIVILEKKIPGFKEAFDESQKAKRWTTLFTDQEANKALENTSFAFGISDTGLIAEGKLKVKILKFNGILPTVDSVARGDYPFTKILNFILPEKEIPTEVKAFIDFVRSDKGEEILKNHGYFTIK